MSFVMQDFLYLLLFLPLLFIVYKTSLVDKKKSLKIMSFFISVLALVCLVLALARPFVSILNKDVHINFLVDVTKSIDLDDLESKLAGIKNQIKELSTNDTYQIFVFGQGLKKVSITKLEELIKDLQQLNEKDDKFGAETNLEFAVKSSRMFYPAGKMKNLIIYSDGKQTNGSFEKTKHFVEQEKIEVKVISIKSKEKREAFVVDFKPSNETAYEGERVRLTATLAMNYDGPVKARFVYDGIVDKQYEVELKANQNFEIDHDVIVRKSGVNVWTVEIEAKEDYFLINNVFSCFVDVKGKPRVLVIHQKEKNMRYFKNAMETQSIHVDVRGKFGIPETLSKLLEYDALVIADMPATLLSSRQMTNIKKYVTEYGGGLLMMGSENSFGLGGYYRTPVEEVLPIVSRYEKEKEKPSMALVLVIDKSGSMSGSPIQLARQAAKSAVDLLGQRDSAGVVGFDSDAFVVSELVSMISKGIVLDSIDTIAAGGGTNMYPAMHKAKEMLESSSAKIKHMILLGDGQSNPGPFVELAQELSYSKITVSTVALGEGADKYLFKEIADKGYGRYYETNDPSTVPQIFTKETVEASKSAIKEMPFTPVKVGSHEMLEGLNLDQSPYLIGYVMTKLKPTAKIQLITEEGDPLLAIGQYGLGKGLAFTSDATEQWAFEWLEWNNFGKFWSQVLRSCLRRENKEGIRIVKEPANNQLELKLSQVNELGALQPNQKWRGLVNSQNGITETISVAPTGFGVYQTSFDTKQQGLYSLKLVNEEEGRSVTTHFQKNYPIEYQLGSPVSAYFDELQKAPPSMQKIQAYSYKDISSYFVLAAMFLLINAIILRRI